jgi:hypothetical protein
VPSDARTENHSVVRAEENGLEEVVHIAIGEGWMIQVNGRKVCPRPLLDEPGTQPKRYDPANLFRMNQNIQPTV